jgi:hypothetical protein
MKNGQPVWRFMVPHGAPEEAAPRGLGDGAYEPLRDVRRVVGVVGTAHVRGLVQEWEQGSRSQDSDIKPLLEV